VKLLIGLGNPGAKYAGHRHNVGFMALDAIARDTGFPAWKSRFQGDFAEGLIDGEKCALLRPGTFMNLSGQAAGEAMRYFRLTPADVTVIHDEIDLAPGRCRLKSGGGHAGHNGLRSLHDHVGPDYTRLRIGIGHPGDKDLVAAYVLHDFSKADHQWLDPLLERIAAAAPFLVRGDQGRFMNAIAEPKSARLTEATGTMRAKPETEKPPEGPLSALGRLLDRFR
jgi:PTH1 family peptidyl-tRNA hydrolase